MELHFATNQLRRCYEESERAIRQWGPQVGRRYIQRIETLYAMKEFSEILQFRSLHAHPLSGSRRGQYAIALTAQWRLIITKGDTESDVTVEEVSRHYGD